MALPDLMTVGGSADHPLSHFRSAMLLVAMAIAAICLPFLLAMPPVYHRLGLDLTVVELPKDAFLIHRLDILRDGSTFLDGVRRCDFLDLRRGLDLMTATGGTLLDIHPDPELRYELFLETFATVKRAAVPQPVIEFVAVPSERPAPNLDDVPCERLPPGPTPFD